MKDLTALRFDLSRTVIIDNSPAAYCLNPDNALPISSWIQDPNDDELLAMLPIIGGGHLLLSGVC